MRILNPLKTLLFLVAIGLFCSPATAQSENPAWFDHVKEQLAREHSCELGFFIRVRESELAGRNTYEARVQCTDGRQFDASKVEPAFKFEIRECKVKVC